MTSSASGIYGNFGQANYSAGIFIWVKVFRIIPEFRGERSGSVVECLTQDRGVRASPASMCCVFEQDTLILA